MSPIFLRVTSTPSEGVSSLSSKSIDECCQSDHNDGSDDDDENYEAVARPFQSNFTSTFLPITSPLLQTVHSHESPTGEAAQPSTDSINNSEQNLHRSPMMNRANPFEAISTQPLSPPLEMARANAAPVDTLAFFASEHNRLDSFRTRGRATFAQCTAEELAYVGFHLNADDNTVECSCCNIRLTEARFEDIMRRRPIIPDSPLNDEPWTAMRVHRHEIGQFTGSTRSWCPWVFRQKYGFYTNIPTVIFRSFRIELDMAFLFISRKAF